MYFSIILALICVGFLAMKWIFILHMVPQLKFNVESDFL